MKKIYDVTTEGSVMLTQYEDGDALLQDSESGDSMYVEADVLVAIGRLTIAAHVTAGRLKRAGA